MFNQFWFLVYFLPIAVGVYWALNAYKKRTLSIFWILLVSLFFYGMVSWEYVPLMMASISGTFFLSTFLGTGKSNEKLILTLGILGNIATLVYFKYTDFFIQSWGDITGSNFDLLHLLIPLGLSFTVFQQITFLMDKYRQKTTEPNLWHYATYVLFFPQIIAGPIVHHQHMMDQFDDPDNHRFKKDVFQKGIAFFALGATKKYILADSLGRVVDFGWDQLDALSQGTAIIINVFYMLQIYLDFSGYTMMALGLALLFGINLPHNFDQPYKSTSVKDFWHRWHITLSHFLRDYVYFSLGGSRKGKLLTNINIGITFLISGLWHGAGWTFVLWGGLHGFAVATERRIEGFTAKLGNFLQWIGTLFFLFFTWILFRSETFSQAWKMIVTTFGKKSESFFESTPISFYDALSQSKLLLSAYNINIVALVLMGISLFLSFQDSPQIKKWNSKKIGISIGLCALLILVYFYSFYTESTSTSFLYGSF